MAPEIVNLQEVLLPQLLEPSKNIVNYQSKHLTAPGENYGSLMLAVDITLQNSETNQLEKHSFVAKMVPANPVIQDLFQSPHTFKKELEWYRTVVPTMQAFQKQCGVHDDVDFFPKYYGGRLGLENPDEFDFNAVIILENLKLQEYETVDRTVGFDLDTSNLLLRDLARMHAIPIAIKLKEPVVFHKKIKPFLNHITAYDDYLRKMREVIVKENLEIAEEHPVCREYLSAIEKVLRLDITTFSRTPLNDKWCTAAHCDYWVNNTMIKFDTNGKPLKNKIVDFQLTDYHSVAKDLSFFLFTSVQNDIIVNKYEELVKEYYQIFIDTLRELHVDTTEFTIEGLEKEMETTLKENTMLHCIGMLKPIFASSDVVKAVDDYCEADFESERPATQQHKEKFWVIVQEFIKRKWIE